MASDKTPQSDNIEKPLLRSSDNTATLFSVYPEDDQIIQQPCSVYNVYSEKDQIIRHLCIFRRSLGTLFDRYTLTES